jgi:hypothetical protein
MKKFMLISGWSLLIAGVLVGGVLTLSLSARVASFWLNAS